MTDKQPVMSGSEKPRRKRRASDYIVLRLSYVDHTAECVLNGNSVANCLKRIKEETILGSLAICCVRRRLETSLEEVLQITPSKKESHAASLKASQPADSNPVA